MKPVLDECIKRHIDPEFRIHETKSMVIFRNPQLLQIEQIKVDGCVFDDGDGKKCDWLINISYTQKSILVELKGRNVEDAIPQLREATKQLSYLLKKQVVWIVCHTEDPRYESTKQNLELKVRRAEGVRLIIELTPYIHTL